MYLHIYGAARAERGIRTFLFQFASLPRSDRFVRQYCVIPAILKYTVLSHFLLGATFADVARNLGPLD